MASVIEKVQSGFKSLSEGKLGEALTMASNLAGSVNATWIQKPGAQSVAGQLETLADSAKTHVTSGPTFTVKAPTQADLTAITTDIPAIPYVEPDASFDNGNAKKLWDILIRTRNEVNAKKKSSPLTPTVIQDIQSSEAQYNTLLAEYKKKYTDWKGSNLGSADKKARDRAFTKSATQELTDANKVADDILKKVLDVRSLYTKGFNENAKTFRDTFISDFMNGDKEKASAKYTAQLTPILDKISHLSLTNSARGISADERNKLTATSKEKKEAADRVAKVIKELPPMGAAPIIAKKGYRDAYNMMKTARDAVITFVELNKEYIQSDFVTLRDAYLAEKARYDNFKGITKKEKQLATDAIAGLTLQEEPRQKNAKAAYAELGINEQFQAIGTAYIAAEAAGRNPKIDDKYNDAKKTYNEAVSEFKAQWMDGDKIRSVSKAEETATASKAAATAIEKERTDQLNKARTLALTKIMSDPPSKELNYTYEELLKKKTAAAQPGATDVELSTFLSSYADYESAVAAFEQDKKSKATPPISIAAAVGTKIFNTPPPPMSNVRAFDKALEHLNAARRIPAASSNANTRPPFERKKDKSAADASSSISSGLSYLGLAPKLGNNAFPKLSKLIPSPPKKRTGGLTLPNVLPLPPGSPTTPKPPPIGGARQTRRRNPKKRRATRKG